MTGEETETTTAGGIISKVTYIRTDQQQHEMAPTCSEQEMERWRQQQHQPWWLLLPPRHTMLLQVRLFCRDDNSIAVKWPKKVSQIIIEFFLNAYVNSNEKGRASLPQKLCLYSVADRNGLNLYKAYISRRKCSFPYSEPLPFWSICPSPLV